MIWVISLGIGLLLIPILLVLIIPLLDSFLSPEFLDFMDNIMGSLDIVIGVNNVNYLFQILSIIMFFLAFKWIMRTVNSFK